MSNDSPLWDDDPPLLLPSAPAHERADVCVVGLGGSGLSAIATLREAGAHVIGIDAQGIASGAAGRNGGFLLAGLADFHHDAVRRFGRDRAAALYRLSLAELERVFASDDTQARRSGSLRIVADDAELRDCDDHADALRADGFAVERYDGVQGRGLLFPDDGVFHPARRWRTLAAHLIENGVKLYGHSPVTTVQRGSVYTAHGEIRVDAVIVAVDGGVERLLPSLVDRVRSARLQMLGTAPVATPQLSRPVYFRYGRDYWQQLADGRIALGGGRDIGGDAEWQAPAQTSVPVQDHLDGLLRTVAPDAVVTHRWAAEVGFTSSGLPLYGEVEPGVFATGAYNGTGNVLGTLCGRALAQRVLGHRHEIERWLE